MQTIIITGIICASLVIIASSIFLFLNEPISDYLRACAEAKRNQEERTELIKEFEHHHDLD